MTKCTCPTPVWVLQPEVCTLSPTRLKCRSFFPLYGHCSQDVCILSSTRLQQAHFLAVNDYCNQGICTFNATVLNHHTFLLLYGHCTIKVSTLAPQGETSTLSSSLMVSIPQVCIFSPIHFLAALWMMNLKSLHLQHCKAEQSCILTSLRVVNLRTSQLWPHEANIS